MHRLWPGKINTPHVKLAIPISEGLKILEAADDSVTEEYDGEEKAYRVSRQGYEMAIYETNGIVSSVWYNDPAGRLTKLGRDRKVHLYMDRYTGSGVWEKRLNNGWMCFYFNKGDAVSLVYGLHEDVIRINMLEVPCTVAA